MNRDQIAEVIETELGRFLRGQGEMEFWRARFRLAADAIMALDGWETIESAPREPMDRFTVLGPPIILGFAPDEEGYTKTSREGYWRPALPPGENGRAYSAGWVSTLDPHVEPPYENPTHWRPLPQPPGDAG